MAKTDPSKGKLEPNFHLDMISFDSIKPPFEEKSFDPKKAETAPKSELMQFPSSHTVRRSMAALTF
jgi:hypothetical protein